MYLDVEDQWVIEPPNTLEPVGAGLPPKGSIVIPNESYWDSGLAVWISSEA